jgi:hypothetical protein
MGDFLSNLVSKSRGAGETVRPRPTALFEPAAAPDGPATGPSVASDDAWREAQGAVHFDRPRLVDGEWEPAAPLAPGSTTDREATPSAAVPRLTPHQERQRPLSPHPLRPDSGQVSSPGTLRPRSMPSAEGPRPPAATDAQPAALPRADRSGAPPPAVEGVQPVRGPSPEELETAPGPELSGETTAEHRPETAPPRPEPRVEPVRAAPGPSATAPDLGSRPQATEGTATTAHASPSSLGEQRPPRFEPPTIPVRPTAGPMASSSEPAEGALRPRIIPRIEPGPPSGAPRQAGAAQQAAESGRPYAFPSIEPATPPSGQPSGRGEPAPTIQVTIGRVEVRAITPPQREAPRRRPTRPESVLTLDEYLKQRNEESR